MNSDLMKNEYENIVIALNRQTEKYEELLKDHEEQALKMQRLSDMMHQTDMESLELSKKIEDTNKKISEINTSFATRNRLFENKV